MPRRGEAPPTTLPSLAFQLKVVRREEFDRPRHDWDPNLSLFIDVLEICHHLEIVTNLPKAHLILIYPITMISASHLCAPK